MIDGDIGAEIATFRAAYMCIIYEMPPFSSMHW
jgi:hypothetical protein